MILRCGDETREVEETSSSPAVTAIAPGTYVLDRGTRGTETFHCVRDGDTIHLSWRGVTYRLVVDGKRSSSRRERGTSSSLETPMPGKVIKVSVAPGQAVRKGDEILVVEAMKMENAVRAPRDGVVKSIAVKVGDMADAGTPLAELE